jgi:hypothetical protein
MRYLPLTLRWWYLAIIAGIPYNLYLSYERNVIPYILIFVVMNVVVLSAVPHKEERFLLSAYPFMFLLAASVLVPLLKIKKYGKIVGILVLGYALYGLYE